MSQAQLDFLTPGLKHWITELFDCFTAESYGTFIWDAFQQEFASAASMWCNGGTWLTTSDSRQRCLRTLILNQSATTSRVASRIGFVAVKSFVYVASAVSFPRHLPTCFHLDGKYVLGFRFTVSILPVLTSAFITLTNCPVGYLFSAFVHALSRFCIYQLCQTEQSSDDLVSSNWRIPVDWLEKVYGVRWPIPSKMGSGVGNPLVLSGHVENSLV